MVTVLKTAMLVLMLLIAMMPAPALIKADNSIIVGVYFYPWYSVSMHRHWDNTVVDEPLIGYYDSYNETVIKWQLELIRDAGIDLIVFSWWGSRNFEDNTTKTIVKHLRYYGLKFAIMVEPYLDDPEYYNKTFWENVLSYIKANYIDPYRDMYFHLNGKPLIMAFNPVGMKYDPEPDFPAYVIRITGNDIDNAGYQDWDLWPDYDTNLTGRLRIRIDGYVALSPRFDDEHFRPGGVGQYDPFLEEKWYRKQWEFVLNNLDEVRIIMIYSWNEYHERSMIEPFIDPKTNIDPWYLYNTTAEYVRELKKPYNYVVEIMHLSNSILVIGATLIIFGIFSRFLYRIIKLK